MPAGGPISGSIDGIIGLAFGFALALGFALAFGFALPFDAAPFAKGLPLF